MGELPVRPPPNRVRWRRSAITPMPNTPDIHQQVTVYTPESRIRRPHELVGSMVRDLAAGRDLAWRLAVRDISAQYRQTLLGIAWAFIIPLATTLTWMFLNGSGVVAVGETDIPYPVYVFTGTMLWSILTDALKAPILQCNQAKSMLSKLNFSKEALIVAAIYKTLFNGGIKVLLMLIGVLALGVMPGWNILLFPLGLFALVLAGTAIGLFLTPIALLYQDISKAIPLGMQFLMYLTPVVYPMPEEGFAAEVLVYNPFTALLTTARDWLTGVTPDLMVKFAVMNAVMILVLLIGWVIYRAAMPILIERMNA